MRKGALVVSDAYTEAVPARLRGQSNADKADAGTTNNILGFAGGVAARYPPLVTYDGREYILHFETLVIDGAQVYGEAATVRLPRDHNGVDVHPGGPGCVAPFIHASDHQLKLYVLHYPGDGQTRRFRIIRTGIYY